MNTRDYEALFILKSAGTDQDIEKAATQLEEPIKKLGGGISRAQSMGKRKLAFRIAKQAEGFYHLVRFTAPTERVRELDKIFRLNERIVRFVIVTGDEVAAELPEIASTTARS